MSAEEIAQVRRFNRLVTQRIGALDDHYLGRDRPLGESRLLYEIGAEGADLRDLRRRLGLDAGYVTRQVQSLEKRGLVRLGRSSADRRVRWVRLMAAGRREVREINRRSDQSAAALLDSLSSAQRGRLVAAMTEVHRLLQLAGLTIERVDPASPIARWCIAQYFAELERRFESGFDPAASPIVDRDFVPPMGAFLVAFVDGEPVACGGIKSGPPGVGTLKRMWVAGTVRGLGIGRRVLEALEAQARDLGLGVVRLETNRALQEAIRFYRSAGFREVSPFNADPYAHHWLEKELAAGSEVARSPGARPRRAR
jgi:DNA-binding MarR family transcriptional regulator/GNAT superfamily N-acetyltransferase